MKYTILLLAVMAGIFTAACARAVADNSADIAAALAAAKTGKVVEVQAGTYTVSGLTIPAGVSLRGAGYGKTTIVVDGQTGIVVSGAGQSKISDLTVRGATSSNIAVSGSSGITISRVRVVGSLTGIMLTSSNAVRLENVVASDNRTGVVMNDCSDSAIVNCTLAQNTALGASIGVNTNCALFNNLIVDSPIGIYVSPANTTVSIDHNFYLANAVGKCNDIAEPDLSLWRDSTGYDRHSASLALSFDSTEPDIYRTTTAFPWAQNRAVVDGWGATIFAGFSAPASDIDGNAHRFGPCVGAWEVTFTPARPADGAFTIHRADGTKSAGLFTKAGKQVVWLFNNLALAPGKYDFWIPTRDWQGRDLAPGDYELRLAEADISFKAVGSGVGGNTGIGTNRTGLAQISNQQIIYDSKDRPVVALGWSESQLNIRAFDANSAHERWFFPGTAPHLGIASDGHGTIYSLRTKGTTPVLLRLDEETGQTKPFADGKYDRYFAAGTFSDQVGGMAILGDAIYLADTGGSRILTANVDDPVFKPLTGVPSPSSPVEDRQRNLVWVLSDHANIVAVAPDGTIKYQFPCPVAGAQSIALAGNRLAVLSYATGKVHIFNCADPTHLTAIGTIGTGDGPYGPIQADRFQFQGLKLDDGALPRLAMDSAGDIGVVDVRGIKKFAPDGSVVLNLVGGWYNSFRLAEVPGPDHTTRVMDLSTNQSYLVDPKSKTSRPECLWDAPGSFMSMFDYHGTLYALYRGSEDALTPQNTHYAKPYIVFVRLDPHAGSVTPIIAWNVMPDAECRTDFTAGINDPFNPSEWKPVMGVDGKQAAFINGSEPVFRSNGDLLYDVGNGFTTYRFGGFDASGLPVYDWDRSTTVKLTGDGGSTFTSPYDFKTQENILWGPPNHIQSFADDGSYARPVVLKTGRMAGLTGNWSGTDLACWNADGSLRWFQPLVAIDGVEGGWTVGGNFYTVHVPYSETQIFSSDGLMLADLGQPKGLPWGGKWLDNALQFAPFIGSDGKTYMIYGDFNECCFFWMAIDGIDNVLRDKVDIHIDPSQASILSAQPLPQPPTPIAPPVTRITITKLAHALPVDGSLDAWRAAVPTPQVIITPESGSADITGPADCSALVRFAHDGDDLYVQVIKFDDVIVFDQPLSGFFLQDGVEMAINSFSTGFKFDVTRTLDKGDILQQERFYNIPPARLLDPAKAPRNITIYENAKDFPERKLIENLYGLDLSNSEVMVAEFMIPIDADTYQADPKALPDTSPGSTIWLGMMIDDNDIPGGDVQKYEVWPSTYGTFTGKETGAIATFE